ncbi:MAG: isocitrate/isopropylmalate dehydrogenase family protein [Firmicutes bacterium]|nr:isocitrate/isopropylmalate dehydrogenase family protein [Bacillota bacterium]
MYSKEIKTAQKHLGKLLQAQFERAERLKQKEEPLDYGSLDTIEIGIAGGDGIGPFLAAKAREVLEYLLAEEIKAGKVNLKNIEGLTIENRIKTGRAIPPIVLDELKQCHVILKGPTTTPDSGYDLPNIESANVAMRRALDLFANVRPVKIPQEKIDWVFFRENTEGAYVLGSQGIELQGGLALDFTVTTRPGTERIIRAAFQYARENKRTRVTAVTKANVIKTTDGQFLEIAREVAQEYPEIEFDDWYIDIMTAKLIDTSRRADFQVFVLPNLYGDILTDEAAQFQGGVGTAGSANLGTRYAMFEAIHGSAPRMVKEGRAEYADPSSMLRAGAMLLEHIGYQEKARRLDLALDVCGLYERKVALTGRPDGATGQEFAAYLRETLANPRLEEVWAKYQ